MTRRSVPAPPVGRGNCRITADGSPVDMYAAMPSDGQAEIVHELLPRGASVLELGCGTGRIADPLTRLGHRVVGVDASPAMLGYLTDAEPVHAEIEALALGEAFDAVLLASTLVNTIDPAGRAAMLHAARRHLRTDGLLVIERHSPKWTPTEGAAWTLGPVELLVKDVVAHGERCYSATIAYRLDALWAEQDFSTRVLDDVALNTDLGSASFRPASPLTPDLRWVAARAR